MTSGGGGTFHNIWTPNTYAQSGFYVSDTTTPGVVYELSAEHHLFGEIKLDRVENWEFHAPQTEEEVSQQPRGGGLRDQRLEEHHDRQLPRLPRDPQLRAVPGRGPRLRLERHPLPQRLRSTPSTATASATTTAAARSCARASSPSTTRVQDVTHRPRGARAAVRRARRPGPAAAAAAAAGRRRCWRRGGRRREARGRFPLDRRRGGGRRRHALLRRQATSSGSSRGRATAA